MRSSLLLVTASLVAGLSLGGCNRMHLYKTAGQATVAAFAVQAAGTDAPRPRGIDGEEATQIINAERQGFAPGDDNSPGAASNGTGAKPAGIQLQAR
jgi:hypothetical protein